MLNENEKKSRKEKKMFYQGLAVKGDNLQSRGQGSNTAAGY